MRTRALAASDHLHVRYLLMNVVGREVSFSIQLSCAGKLLEFRSKCRRFCPNSAFLLPAPSICFGRDGQPAILVVATGFPIQIVALHAVAVHSSSPATSTLRHWA